jgi:hypothetical protein
MQGSSNICAMKSCEAAGRVFVESWDKQKL